MQSLFFMDIRNCLSAEMIDLFCDTFTASKTPDFFRQLVTGVVAHRGSIDALIEGFSDHWKLHRMSCVDRNILRIAVYELMYRPDIPAKVSINEAIDIGKKFGTEDSGAFINGILDSIRLSTDIDAVRKDHRDPEWDRSLDTDS
jgi:N utilization substance protein B